jgi:hypothetical protein
MELPASEWRDAEIEDQAIAANKPTPKVRAHTAKHEQLIQDLAHRLKVMQLGEARARDALRAALAEHGDTWRADYVADAAERLQTAESAFQTSLRKLTTDYGAYASAVATGRQLDIEHAGVGIFPFDARRDFADRPELAQGANPKATIAVETVLGKLADLGTSTPQEPVRVGMPDRVGAQLQARAKASQNPHGEEIGREQAETAEDLRIQQLAQDVALS